MTFSYADAAKKLSGIVKLFATSFRHIFLEVGIDEKEPLLNEEVMYLGSYANAIKVENGMKPPAYEAVQPATETIAPPLSPPSTTLLSIYSEPIQVEYEESERILQAGCSTVLWNYFACCGYIKADIFEKFHDTNSRMVWTMIGCFCCIIPLLTLLIIFLRV